MLELIAATMAITAVVLVTTDLLGNHEIFVEDTENTPSVKGIFPYGHTGPLSCDTAVYFTPKDLIRAELAAQEIRTLLEKQPIESLCEMDAGARIDFAIELHRRLCNIFSLDLEFELGDTTDDSCGCYSDSKQLIRMNYRFLLSDKKEYICEYLRTFLHEFRHAMQYRMIADINYNDVESSYRSKMAVNLNSEVYVPFTENPELYYKQLCERDAREYSERIMRLLKGEEKECQSSF